MSAPHRSPRTQALAEALAAGRSSLTESEGKAVLTEVGIPVPRSRVVHTPEEVPNALADLDGPFALKVMAPEILHKSDAGGVAIGLVDGDAVAEAIREMRERPLIAAAVVSGFLVEEMAPAGTEMVLGGIRDPQFGPLLMVGLGGIFVEVLEDVSFRLCPISRADGFAMLDELRGAAILDGARGVPPASRDAIVDALLALGGEGGLMLRESAAIAEIDVNPLIVGTSGAVAVDARIIVRPLSSRASARETCAGLPRESLPPLERFRPLFSPRTVAVVGASSTSTTIANTFIRRMKAYGFPGELYPIHPQAERIEGLPAYSSLAETPQPVDYAYIAVGANRTPEVVASAAGNVAFAQVIASGFRESGDNALEDRLVEAARAGGVRLIGPNCLGTYSPRDRALTFPADAPTEPGVIGIVTQSGGLGTDVIKRGQWRGLGFSALVTAGNCADIGPCDLLEFYLHDPQTRVIGLYLEDVGDGRRFFDLLRFDSLRSGSPVKPVVVLRGGRSALGRVAAASHTGALAGDGRAWQALAAQVPVVLVDTVDEFLDVLLALQCLVLCPERPTSSVALFGNGGGTSVLATDFFAERGLAVSPFGPAAQTALAALELPPGTSIVNPVDTPVSTLQREQGRIASRILEIIFDHAQPEALVMHLNLASFVGRGDVDPVDNLIEAGLDIGRLYPGQAHFVLVLRVDGSPELDEAKRRYCARARTAGIPVYDELPQAARALAAVAHLENILARRTQPEV